MQFTNHDSNTIVVSVRTGGNGAVAPSATSALTSSARQRAARTGNARKYAANASATYAGLAPVIARHTAAMSMFSRRNRTTTSTTATMNDAIVREERNRSVRPPRIGVSA